MRDFALTNCFSALKKTVYELVLVCCSAQVARAVSGVWAWNEGKRGGGFRLFCHDFLSAVLRECQRFFIHVMYMYVLIVNSRDLFAITVIGLGLHLIR